VVPFISQGTAGQQMEHGPQAFAATVDDIMPNLIDQDDLGLESLLDALVYARHIIGYQGVNFLNIHEFSDSGENKGPAC